MSLSKQQIVDLLRRSEAMEEDMSGMIADILKPEMLPKTISVQDQDSIMSMLAVVKADTIRHKKIVSDIMARLNKE